ncbi:hypothetical protein BGX24_007729, partial [Mortierella sp. AD032]
PQSIVRAYLRDGSVITRNAEQETFETSIQVFVDLRQTQVENSDLPSTAHATFLSLQHRFATLSQRHDAMKRMRLQSPDA